MVKTAVILPAHNEDAVIKKMVTMLLRLYPEYISNIIVVNDCSTDNTGKIVKSMQKIDNRIILVSRTPPGGVGLAIRDGLKKVPKNITHVLTFDADFIRNVPDLYEFFEKINGFDGLIGSRYLTPHSLIRYPLFKKICNRLFHLVARFMFRIPHHDLTNNFKLYKKSVFDSLPLSENNFAINAETGLYPVIMGYNIGELPVTWYAREAGMGISKFNLLDVAPAYIRVLFKSRSLKRHYLKRT